MPPVPEAATGLPGAGPASVSQVSGVGGGVGGDFMLHDSLVGSAPGVPVAGLGKGHRGGRGGRFEVSGTPTGHSHTTSGPDVDPAGIPLTRTRRTTRSAPQDASARQEEHAIAETLASIGSHTPGGAGALPRSAASQPGSDGPPPPGRASQTGSGSAGPSSLPPSTSIDALQRQMQQLTAAVAQTHEMLAASAGNTTTAVPTPVPTPRALPHVSTVGDDTPPTGAGESSISAMEDAALRAAAATAAEAVARAANIPPSSPIVSSAVDQAMRVAGLMMGSRRGSSGSAPSAGTGSHIMGHAPSAGVAAHGGRGGAAGGAAHPPSSVGHVPVGDSASVLVAAGDRGGTSAAHATMPSTAPAPAALSMPAPRTSSAVPGRGGGVHQAGPAQVARPVTDMAAAAGAARYYAAQTEPAGAAAPALPAGHLSQPAGHLPSWSTATTPAQRPLNTQAMAAASLVAASRRVDHQAPQPVERSLGGPVDPGVGRGEAEIMRHVSASVTGCAERDEYAGKHGQPSSTLGDSLSAMMGQKGKVTPAPAPAGQASGDSAPVGARPAGDANRSTLSALPSELQSIPSAMPLGGADAEGTARVNW